MKLLPLSALEFEKSLDHFQECQRAIFLELTDTEQQAVTAWIKSKVTLVHPVYSLRTDALSEITEQLFGNATQRDFVFDLGFLFFTSVGIPDYAKRLSLSLDEGLRMDGYSIEYSLVPTETLTGMASKSLLNVIEPAPWYIRLYDRWFAPKNDLITFLSNNKSLLVWYLLYLANPHIDPAPDAKE